MSLTIPLIAGGCGHSEDEAVLPWCRYRTGTTPGGTGMWSGSTYAEVRVRRWWGWSMAFDRNSGPGRPVVLTPTAVLVASSEGVRILHQSDPARPLACGDRQAVASVPPGGGFIDCTTHLAGPAPAIATSLRVRHVDPAGQLVAQQEVTAREPGRVFLRPAIAFYDDQQTPYLVTFRDPWLQTTPNGPEQRGQASPERLAQIACELIAVGPTPTPPVPAPPGHTVADCSSAKVWSRSLGRDLSPAQGMQR